MDENDFILLLESDDMFGEEEVRALRELDSSLREKDGVLAV